MEEPSIVGDTAVVNDIILNIEIADTPETRTQGLSGRSILQYDKGLLFIFEKSGFYPFWMKDMNFPIDIIWINKNLNIVHIKEKATPDSYPKTFVSGEPALYVLEVNAGVVADKKIKIGDKIVLNIFRGK
jgi:uncharacterized membrane protein (UPF0127 family)